MSVVMILRGLPCGGSTGFEGQYLKDFDHEALGGRGEIAMTKDLDEAKRFPSMVEAFQFYQRVPACKPLRPDLKPNRPLTGTNWEFKQLEAVA